jgi:hypothetical protein
MATTVLAARGGGGDLFCPILVICGVIGHLLPFFLPSRGFFFAPGGFAVGIDLT